MRGARQNPIRFRTGDEIGRYNQSQLPTDQSAEMNCFGNVAKMADQGWWLSGLALQSEAPVSSPRKAGNDVPGANPGYSQNVSVCKELQKNVGNIYIN